jgi:hypothetical protein
MDGFDLVRCLEHETSRQTFSAIATDSTEA